MVTCTLAPHELAPLHDDIHKRNKKRQQRRFRVAVVSLKKGCKLQVVILLFSRWSGCRRCRW